MAGLQVHTHKRRFVAAGMALLAGVLSLASSVVQAPASSGVTRAAPPAVVAEVPLSSGTQIDVYQPQILGWDSTRGGYHFRVYFTWKAICGGVYCILKDGTTAPYKTSQNLSDPDIVSLAFDKPMQVKSVLLESWAACGRAYRSSTRITGTDTTWDGASSEVQDTVYPDSSCGSSLEYLSYCAVGGGGGGCTSWYENATMTYGYYHVWANPVSGCNSSMRARGFYAHSWSSTSITVSPAYPWGVGITASSSSNWWSVSNRSDWDFDDDYLGSVCRR